MSDLTPPPPPPPPGGQFYGAYPSEEKNSLGVWALVLGILAIVCSCGPFTGIPAIILGKKAKEAQEQALATNGSLGTVGMVLGIVGTALFGIGLVLYFAVGGLALAQA
ncbi:DUF4190 domain-containing protein [Demequina sp.]|uniref:DUF4190 domain-containing protein n=1 Tax=Demequina sp. TaxID=2050685 RepID=UPI003A8A3471